MRSDGDPKRGYAGCEKRQGSSIWRLAVVKTGREEIIVGIDA